jgi:hypothetical protein
VPTGVICGLKGRGCNVCSRGIVFCLSIHPPIHPCHLLIHACWMSGQAYSLSDDHLSFPSPSPITPHNPNPQPAPHSTPAGSFNRPSSTNYDPIIAAIPLIALVLATALLSIYLAVHAAYFGKAASAAGAVGKGAEGAGVGGWDVNMGRRRGEGLMKR